MPFESELMLARQLIRNAGELSLRYAREGFSIEDKPDDSPVTIADKECEKLIVEGIDRIFPHDGLLGEEGANRDGTSGRRWIIDPIDGTRDFVRGNRFFSNFIALEANGVPVAGAVGFPALGESYFAAAGAGAWREFDGRTERISISDISIPQRAVCSYNGLSSAARRPHAPGLLEFLSTFWTVRSMGGALDSMLVCSGKAELWIEGSAKPWDLAPLAVIAKESGALLFDHTGAETIYGGNGVICVPALRDIVLDFLR